ncbi:MAG TPA: Asp-tRNA(Asn)/Glu-tRNA(Gln) amidotransferase GatCAB subunit C, partial [Cyanobacteria bacterium UBA11162]|nr:Asp-tRNA(Asn)/Glu-tRNA(Gln) amidotransferase GatCAB subunit C [Cyanobacteria bacterium UBA11162]
QPYPDREALLREAPDQDGDFFKVPQILSTEE